MGCDQEYGNDWVEITPEELNSIFETDDEIELDLDEFVSFWDQADYEQTLAEEEEPEIRMCQEKMRQSLAEGNYRQAFKDAMELRKRRYSSFKDEIDNCIQVCAKHDISGALVIEAGKYTCRGTGKIDPGGFEYLRHLSDLGYIKSFRWLADCYFYGIGCEQDKEKAARLYFEGVLFDKCNYCGDKYVECQPEILSYSGNDLLKRLIRDLISLGRWWSDKPRIKIAELILDGVIGDYEAEAAYVLLKEAVCEAEDGIGYLRLGECLLFGVGVERNPIMASFMLDEAEYSIKRALHGQVSQREIEEAYHENIDYKEAYQRAKELAETARQRKEEALNDYEFFMCALEPMDPDLIYDEWENKVPRYIKRSNKL